MMETRPAAALIMAEADFLLEVFIIALDTPAHLGEIDETAERHVRVDGCEPVFGGLGLVLGPFDEQRLFGETCFGPDRRSAHAHTGKARSQLHVGAFPPRDGAPGALGQAERQCFDADARRLRIVLAHRAYFDGRYDGCDVAEPQSREVLAQLAVVAVTRIHPTTGSWRRSAGAFDAALERAPDPSPPRSAPRCAGLPSRAAQSNNPAAVSPGRHARLPSSVHQGKSPNDPRPPFRYRDPSQPPADRNLDNHLILNQDHMRPTDSPK